MPAGAGRCRHDRAGHHEPRRQCPRRHAQRRHADDQHQPGRDERRLRADPSRSAPRARLYACASPTPAAAWTPPRWPASSSRSSPPKKSAKAPAWAWRPSMASSSSTKAGSGSPAKSARAPPSTSFSPPAPSRSRRRRRKAPLTAAVRGGHETILVVEDEPVLRDMAHVILQDCGYQVLEAGSGAEALQVWERHPGAIDLVLTDVVMPGRHVGPGTGGQDCWPTIPDSKSFSPAATTWRRRTPISSARAARFSCRNLTPASPWPRPCAKPWTSEPSSRAGAGKELPSAGPLREAHQAGG